MKIERLVLGDFQTNCFVVRRDESVLDCLVIDPGLDAGGLMEILDEQHLRPTAVILTHGHIDHIEGLRLLRKRFASVKVHIHRLDAPMLADPEANLSVLFGEEFRTAPAEVLLEDGDTIREAGIELSVLHTPGHTPGGIGLYVKAEGVLFSGDSLFAGSIGRTDFPGGDMDQLLAGIRQKLLTLPDETVVFSGHGNRTTIGRERRCNPYLAANA